MISGRWLIAVSLPPLTPAMTKRAVSIVDRLRIVFCDDPT